MASLKQQNREQSDIDHHVKDGDKRKLSSSSLVMLKKPKLEQFDSIVPAGFLARIRTLPESSPGPFVVVVNNNKESSNQIVKAPFVRSCKQFWKAGDYEELSVSDYTYSSVGMDHVRVHPKFLHSNATSHKWALGAFAELLDNSLDEICNGATYVNVDVLKNQRDGSVMLLVEDNGGGMNPDKMRQCMSLGYSAKSKMANTIGQYGNGFKTSTMRLGADVVVFSRCNDGKSQTQSIGLLSYTFLTATGKEDIVVPMIDFEKKEEANWNKKIRSSLNDWNTNLEIILQWTPFLTEEDLFQQFNFLEDQGTRIIIYNLWEDDEGCLELDFDTDPHDIQIRGVNRDEKNIQMANQYPNSKHFLTYQHSLRIYVSILYLRLPTGFRIILRGKEIEHHDIVNDMMEAQEIIYRPQHLPEGMSKKHEDVVAKGMMGFVKDACHHIDVQGFNVYHKNRLIKPFWRVWNPAGSDGRGVIGLIEANFVEPAHDKQGFERTIVLQRLEGKLVSIQRDYWTKNCQLIGYAPRRNLKNQISSRTECSLSSNKDGQGSARCGKRSPTDAISPNQQSSITGNQRFPPANAVNQNAQAFNNMDLKSPADAISPNQQGSITGNQRFPRANSVNQNAQGCNNMDLKSTVDAINPNQQGSITGKPRFPPANSVDQNAQGSNNMDSRLRHSLQFGESPSRNLNDGEASLAPARPLRDSAASGRSHSINDNGQSNNNGNIKGVNHLKQNGPESTERLNGGERVDQLTIMLREKTIECEAVKEKAERLDHENHALVDIIEGERASWATAEEELLKRLEDALKTIEHLQERVRQLEGSKLQSCKIEQQ
ncbi:hypothetical protein P3X46_011482 [Hevea brasiliensis]|uniref:Morc S5 domain-containing protein n=1 Tax=Hevea brasiliensis TaxID=3981 RepID=A0ABQ9M7A9_HEVBR|nr:protein MICRORCHIDIA 7 [Hevea brasiliensis]KAJ9176137.1 hypothetical protein P3X46_011482 [Hevea brasiliensis]